MDKKAKKSKKPTNIRKAPPRHLDGQVINYAMRRQAVNTELAYTQQKQQTLWLWVLAMHDEFGFGPERINRLLEAIQKRGEKVNADVEENGSVYAWERVRQEAEAVSGIKINYCLDDAEGDFRREQKEEDKRG